MSGQQIGTVIGGVIGAYFGNPQLGMAIGGFIGGLIDPTKINGPHIGDGQRQTATDGSPIAWVQGTSPFIAGTIIEVGGRYEVKIKDSGKGGPTVSHYEARQSFAILICESSEIKGSTIGAVLMVEQDGKIVYDVRPGSKMLVESYKWRQNVDFLYGAESQMPHPTIESINGVGNANPYRGRCVAVFKDFNISNAGNRIPSFRFVVATAVTATTIDNVLPSLTYNTTMPSPGHLQDTVIGTYQDIAVSMDAVTSGTSGKLHITKLENWATYKYVIIPLYGEVIEGTTQLLTDAAVLPWLDVSGVYDSGWHTFYGGDLPDRMLAWFSSVGHAPPTSSGGGITVPINVTAPGRPTGYRVLELWYFGSFDANASEIIFQIPDAGNLDLEYYDPKYYIEPLTSFLWRPSWIVPLGMKDYAPANASLSEICAALCKRGGLSPIEYDTSELDGIITNGYLIAKQATAAECLAPLLAAYFAYGAEYDAKLYFRLFGADADVTVDRNDIAESESGDDNAGILATKRGQATEYPKKITVNYYDPAQNYMVVSVTNERLSSDVLAIGEQSLPIPVVMSADDAARAGAKAMKVAYARLEGTREFAVPFVGRNKVSYLSLVPGDAFILDSKRWSVDEVTLSGGLLRLKATYSRQSAFTSNIQAIPGNEPLPPPSVLAGGTNVLPMNLPSLRPQDTYGLYVAISGTLSSWPGATVQISYDEGLSWANVFDTPYASTMGWLTANEAGGVLSVTVNDTLESVTADQIAVGANAAVVVGLDDAAEVIQFATATETAADNYDLSNLTRAVLDTPTRARTVGDQFTMLDAVHFVPIDTRFAGKTIMFRGVTYGTATEDAQVVQITYNPDLTVIHDGGEVT